MIMNDSRKFSARQYRLITCLIALIIYFFVVGIFFQIPEKYHSLYALLLSVIFLADVMLLPSLKNGERSEDEKRAYPWFVILALGLVLASSVFIYLKMQPEYWIFSFITVSSVFTGFVIFQYLRDRKIIP